MLESPGALTARVKSVSQPPLEFELVLPPPVDRQAVPASTVLLNTSVPLAKVFGFVVCAVNVAKVPAPARAPMAATTPMLNSTFLGRLSFMCPPWQLPLWRPAIGGLKL